MRYKEHLVLSTTSSSFVSIISIILFFSQHKQVQYCPAHNTIHNNLISSTSSTYTTNISMRASVVFSIIMASLVGSAAVCAYPNYHFQTNHPLTITRPRRSPASATARTTLLARRLATQPHLTLPSTRTVSRLATSPDNVSSGVGLVRAYYGRWRARTKFRDAADASILFGLSPACSYHEGDVLSGGILRRDHFVLEVVGSMGWHRVCRRTLTRNTNKDVPEMHLGHGNDSAMGSLFPS